MIIKCSECIFWLREENNNNGQCRQKAPRPLVTSKPGAFIGPYNYKAVWPYTREADGCAEGQSGRKMRVQEEMRDQLQVRETRKPEEQPTTQSFDDQVRRARRKNGR
jgi:hypothetical protein